MTAINGKTQLLGVIGDPVSHSLSPTMHNLALAKRKLNWCYVPFHVTPDQLPQAVRGFVAAGLKGFNATLPHKETLFALMDEVDPEAWEIRAINTVVITEDGRLHGYNTDAYGFLTALQEAFPTLKFAGLRVAIIGAGGAARAVLAGLLQKKVGQVHVANRSLTRAERLCAAMNPGTSRVTVGSLTAHALALEEIDLLINTTRLGLPGEAVSEGESLMTEINLARMPSSARVYDVIYGTDTPFLQRARLNRLAAADGLGMLIHQGARAFELWTGQKMPVKAVRQHLQAVLDQPGP